MNKYIYIYICWSFVAWPLDHRTKKYKIDGNKSEKSFLKRYKPRN